jgi:glyoxylase-like metal-dependent hydrolase (beta-lactamase superfamily II)
MARVEIGDFRVTLVRAGAYWWDAGAMFGVVPRTLWSRQVTPDELNRIPLAFNCYVVETGDHTVLVETGGGDKMDPRARDRMRLPPPVPLPELIAREGIDPGKIGIVLNTHLHWDHCGWNTIQQDGVARPAFPAATYYTRRAEWEHAHERHPRDSVSYIDANYDPLVESGRMILFEEAEREIVPGIRMTLAPGHNRDMMVVTAESRGQTFVFFSDLVPSTAHLTPTWVAAFDLYPLETIAQKRAWLQRAAAGAWTCGLGHDPKVAFIKVRQDDDSGLKFSALQS